jgi:hypothetical protein
MRSDHTYEVVDGQVSFDGGMRLVGDTLAENEYRYSENMIVRHGDAETRPGIRRAFRVLDAGFQESFYFNEENARYNDATHTGFWFPWQFVGSAWGDIQGVAFFRFLDDDDFRVIVVSDGQVFVHERGFVTSVPTAETIATTESIEFVSGQGANDGTQYLVMLRGEDENPMYWDGADTGFVAFTSPGTTNRIPKSQHGCYAYGRLWLVRDRDDVYASDSLDFDTYNFTDQLFGVNPRDGDELVRLLPFHDNYIICFKERAIYVLNGVNEPIAAGGALSDNVSLTTVSRDVGLVSRNAVVVHGEQVTFLSYKGITSLARTKENTLVGRDQVLSAPIQPIIDRINWDAASVACAGSHNDYLLFAVPLDGATVNSHVIVYDLQANGGRGAFVGLWQSELMNPIQFFSEKENIYFLDNDGAFREMFTGDPWDSEDVFDDTSLWDNSILYDEGVLVSRETAGEISIYRCLIENTNKTPEDEATYWEKVSDTSAENLYPVVSKLWTRFYEHGDRMSPKRFSRGEIRFAHQDPSLSVQIEDRDPGTLVDLFDAQTFDRTKYDIAGHADWEPNNEDLDWWNAHREDYTVYLDAIKADAVIDGADASPDPSATMTYQGENNGKASYQYSRLSPLLTVSLSYGFGDWFNDGLGDRWRIEYFTILGGSYWYKFGDSPSGKYQPYIGSGTPVVSLDPLVYMDQDIGLDLNRWEIHGLRFIPRVINAYAYALRLTNALGSVKIKAILNKAQQGQFGKRDR